MDNSEFTCCLCLITYTKGRQDEVAWKEGAKKFPDLSIKEMELVCDDCVHPLTLFNEDPDKFFSDPLMVSFRENILKKLRTSNEH